MSTLDLRGAAALMNVHPRTVEAMARDGRLPAAKIGRAYVLLERDILAFIERTIACQTAKRGADKPTCLRLTAAPKYTRSGSGPITKGNRDDLEQRADRTGPGGTRQADAGRAAEAGEVAGGAAPAEGDAGGAGSRGRPK